MQRLCHSDAAGPAGRGAAVLRMRPHERQQSKLRPPGGAGTKVLVHDTRGVGAAVSR